MSGCIETRIPGDPAAFGAVADHLRGFLADRARGLADRTAAERSSLAGSWRGAAADAFGERAATLTTAGDGVAEQARLAAAEVESLGEVLALAQHGMAQVRARATAGGLQVEGTMVLWPRDAWRLDLLETTALQQAWNDALAAAEVHRRSWYAALERAADLVGRQASTLLGLTADLVVTAAEQALLLKAARILAGEAEFRAGEAERCRSRIPEVAERIERFNHPADRSLLYRLADEELGHREAAATLAESARDPELPRELRGGFGAVSAALVGYGVYADIHEGESTQQAVVSQGAGLLGGSIGAAALGAGAGSFAPGPGTLAGAVVVGGAAFVGGAVGSLFGDKVVDHAYGSGQRDDEPPVEPDPGAELLDYATEALTSPHDAGRREAP